MRVWSYIIEQDDKTGQGQTFTTGALNSIYGHKTSATLRVIVVIMQWMHIQH